MRALFLLAVVFLLGVIIGRSTMPRVDDRV